MTKFILKLTVFLSPLVLLLAVTEYKARFITGIYEEKRLAAEQNIEKAEIIILGSSHTYLGIKAGLLGVPASNLAYLSQDIYYDNRILFKYLPRAKNLKTAVIAVSYPSFEVRTEDWRASFYSRFWHIPPASKVPRLSDYSFTALYGIYESRNYLLTNRLSHTDKIDGTGSNIDLYPINPSLTADYNINLRRHESHMNESLIPANLRYMTEMIEALKAANVRVVLVTTPCFRTYNDKMNPEKYAVMQENVGSLIKKHNIEYYNFQKDERFTEEDFIDADHLNTKGSEKFTLLLKAEIL